MQPERDIPPGASPVNGLPPPVHTRWKKGQSGNPGGRPKGKSIVASLREVLEREHNGRRVADLIAERLAKEALSGKFPFLKEVLDRVEGRVGEQHEVTVKSNWREAVANMSADDLIDMAIEHDRIDLLPVALREQAQKRLEGDHG